jgi:hypothetical protein
MPVGATPRMTVYKILTQCQAAFRATALDLGIFDFVSRAFGDLGPVSNENLEERCEALRPR